MVVRSATGVDAIAHRAIDQIRAGATMGIGALPHRSGRQAAEFALDAYEIPTIPTLPRRSPAESPAARALVGIPGVTFGPYGTLAIDAARLDPDAPLTTDFRLDHFGGFRAFLEVAAERRFDGPVGWHVTGPISVGAALMKAGAAPDVAYAVAANVVRSRARAVATELQRVLPGATQVAVIKEPFATSVMKRDAALSPDAAIDLLSGAMASVAPFATISLHCCGEFDLSWSLAAGPDIISFPASYRVGAVAGALRQYLDAGGWVAWGAVATGGPVGVTANRSWHQLLAVWTALADRGCSLERLSQQCLVTPECGMGSHGVPIAERICRSLHDISRSVRAYHPTAAGR